MVDANDSLGHSRKRLLTSRKAPNLIQGVSAINNSAVSACAACNRRRVRAPNLLENRLN